MAGYVEIKNSLYYHSINTFLWAYLVRERGNSMICKIGVIAGDGIGPEVVAEAQKVLDAIGEK